MLSGWPYPPMKGNRTAQDDGGNGSGAGREGPAPEPNPRRQRFLPGCFRLTNTNSPDGLSMLVRTCCVPLSSR